MDTTLVEGFARRGFLRTVLSAATALCTAPLARLAAAEPVRGMRGYHLSVDRDSPFYGGALCARVRDVFLDGERVNHCVELSEPDGFVVQTCYPFQDEDTTRYVGQPNTEFLPDSLGADGMRPGRPRVKRYGRVRVTFRALDA